MDLNLEQAYEEPVELAHVFDVPGARLDRPELVSLDPVPFQGRLEKADPGFELRGGLELSGVVSCARCLKDVTFRRKAPVTWLFVAAHKRPESEEEIELQAADLEVVWYDELVVPLDPLVDEQIQLELPMKVLCREDCRGLCPSCGVDRNEIACECREPGDDRWTPLRGLIKS